jgi:hypothetical protein
MLEWSRSSKGLWQNFSVAGDEDEDVEVGWFQVGRHVKGKANLT